MKEKKLTILSYNLHGIQKNDEWRFGKISYEINRYNVDLCGFQEVINGNGIEDTSYQVAYHLNNISGQPYTTHWVYCHNFEETYPEGLSILSRFPITSPLIIDLNQNLSCNISPLLPRYALTCSFKIGQKKILFTTLHLDHHKDRYLRASQAEKLVEELEIISAREDCNCSIITGDFNDLDRSPCLKYFKEQGYVDSYREINKKGGNTFHSSKPTVRIDYVLIKGEVSIDSSELILYDSSLSDHVGIVTTISFPDKKKVKTEKRKTGEIKAEEVKRPDIPEEDGTKTDVEEDEV